MKILVLGDIMGASGREVLKKNLKILIEKKNIFDSKFHLIFFDPPFRNTNIEKLIIKLKTHCCVTLQSL